MKWNACVDHSDSPARINLVVKVFLCFLIILSPTHNHASLEMSDEPEGLPVRDEVATVVTMLHVTCYVKEVRIAPFRLAQGGWRGQGSALAGGQEGDRNGLGRRATGNVARARVGSVKNVFVAVVFAVRSARLFTFPDFVTQKTRIL